MSFSLLHCFVLAVASYEDFVADNMNHAEVTHQKQSRDGKEKDVSFW
jgi:hypothetical protein